MNENGVEILAKSPPRVGLECFREAIRHGADDAVVTMIRCGGSPEEAAKIWDHITNMESARRRLLALVDQMEREQKS